MARHLTDRLVASLKPKAAPYFVYDDDIVGFAVKTYSTGTHSFTFEAASGVSGKPKRQVIGRYPSWSAGKARDHARRLRLRVDAGEMVLVGRGPKLIDLAKRWRDVVARTRRRRTGLGYMQALDKHILPQFGGRDPRTITRNEVESWHANVAETAPVGCNRVIAIMSVLMNWLERDELILRNPCKSVRRRPETPRHVYLGATETDRATELLDAELDRAAALALRIAIATGCRIGEAIGMSAAQIDFGRAVWIKPSSATKQRKIHVSPLPRSVLPIVVEYLSLKPPPYHRCLATWRKVAAKLGRPEVRVHHLRHSKASSLARNGASLLQIGRLLGHSASVTTQRYVHLVDDDLRDLVERTS